MRLQLYMVPVTNMDQLLSPFVSTVLHKVYMFPWGGFSQNNWGKVSKTTQTTSRTKSAVFPALFMS